MRIIAGKYRGQRLQSFNDKGIRPTTDRVKETLFNILQQEIPAAMVLDLFSGTGNLSFEALSRGAAKVVAVEKSKKSIAVIRSNIKKLKLDEPIEVVHEDVLSFLNNKRDIKADVILIDPPFTQKMAHDVMLKLTESSIFHQDTVIMIESSAHERLDEVYGVLRCWKKKEFGDKNLSFFHVERDNVDDSSQSSEV